MASSWDAIQYYIRSLQIYELIIACEEGWSELSIGLAWGPVAGSKIFCLKDLSQ